jgi:DNA-binding response OmpR family regulator
MLTAMPGQFCKLFGYEVGVSEFLEKPFDVQTLLARVRSLLDPVRHRPVTNP